MKCTRPLTLYYNEKGERVSYRPGAGIDSPPQFAKYVPCGKCLSCRINKRREWTLRLCHEEVFSSSAFFVTLTYDEEHVPFDSNGNMAVSKEDVQKFMKRLRYRCGDGIRFFLNSEYGELGRPHYHALIFNIPSELMFEGARRIFRKGSISFTCPFLMSIWKMGNVEFGTASKERAGYTARYFIDRKEIDPILVPNFSLMSRNPGIGNAYMKEIIDKVKVHGLRGCLNASGTYVALPRYYRTSIYDPDELHAQFVASLEDEDDPDYLTMLNNADLVEEMQYKAMTWKGKKQKL